MTRSTPSARTIRANDAASFALTRSEVPAGAPAHRVDQVVGDFDTLPGAAQCLGARDVSLVHCEAVAFELTGAQSCAVAHEAAHLKTRLRQRGREAAADEARGARDEHAASHSANDWCARRGHGAPP